MRCLLPFLNNGVIVECLNFFGNVPVDIQRLKSWLRKTDIWLWHSLKNFSCRSWMPPCFFRSLIISDTSLALLNWKNIVFSLVGMVEEKSLTESGILEFISRGFSVKNLENALAITVGSQTLSSFIVKLSEIERCSRFNTRLSRFQFFFGIFTERVELFAVVFLLCSI